MHHRPAHPAHPFRHPLSHRLLSPHPHPHPHPLPSRLHLSHLLPSHPLDHRPLPFPPHPHLPLLPLLAHPDSQMQG